MILTFNAKSVGCDVLEKTLVGRKQLVDELFGELHQKCLNDETYQSLLVASRGSGKTHLTKVIYCRLKQAMELKDKIVISYLVEDEYGIVNFLHFCLRVLAAIDRYNELSGAQIKEKIQEISTLPTAQQTNAVSIYLRSLIGPKKIIVLVENLDSLLNGMNDKGASIRDFMHEHNCLSLIATSQSLSKHFNDGQYPFYNFFKTRHLKKLNFEEAFELIKALIEVEENENSKKQLQDAIGNSQDIKNKIRAIYELTGGNHRLLVHFYGFLKADIKSDLSKVFVKQMNDLKTYYEQFVNALSVQQQRIVQLLSLNHTPLQGKQISHQSFLETNVVSKQLSELYKLGFIDKYKEGKNVFYEIREPLMRICFEINENPDGSAKLFIDFLKIIYDEKERQKSYLKFKIGAISIGTKLEQSYLDEANIYEKTLNPESKENVELILKKLYTCPPEQLEDEIANEYQENKSDRKTISKNASEIKPNSSTIILDFEDAKVFYNLGNDHDRNSEYDLAILQYFKALKINPNYSKAHNNLGNQYFYKGQYNLAIEAYLKAIEIDPKDALGFYNLGNTYRKINEYDLAKQAYLNSIEIKSNESKVYISLGIIYIEKGQNDLAIAAFSNAIKIDPKSAGVFYSLGNAYYQKGEFDLAIKAYLNALKIDPNYGIAFYNLGNTYNEKGEKDLAIESYLNATRIIPNEARAFFNLGSVYISKGEYNLAIESYLMGIKVEPKDAMAFNNLGIAYYYKEEYDLAIEAYTNALKIYPNEVRFLKYLGIAHDKKNEYNLAIKAYSKAANVDPNDADFLLSLGNSYKNLGDYDLAIEAFLNAIAIQRNDPRLHDCIALTYLEKNDIQNAVDSIQKAIKIEPNNSFFLSSYVRIKFFQNDFNGVFKLLNQIFNEELDYTTKMLAEDLIEALFRWVPEQLLDETLEKFENYFSDKQKLNLFYESFIFVSINVLVKIEKYSLEKLELLLSIFKKLSTKSEKIILPSLFLKVGIDYFKNTNKEAIYQLSKEERQLFTNEVVNKRKLKM